MGRNGRLGPVINSENSNDVITLSAYIEQCNISKKMEGDFPSNHSQLFRSGRATVKGSKKIKKRIGLAVFMARMVTNLLGRQAGKSRSMARHNFFARSLEALRAPTSSLQPFGPPC